VSRSCEQALTLAAILVDLLRILSFELSNLTLGPEGLGLGLVPPAFEDSLKTVIDTLRVE
jgi:hypothetical protein